MNLSDREVDDRVRSALDAAAQAVLLPTPEWPGSSEHRVRRPLRRSLLVAIAASLMVLGGSAIFVVQRQGATGNDLVVGPSVEGSAATSVELPVDTRPTGTWEPGTGQSPGISGVPKIARDPVSAATFAVQRGEGERWWWMVAGADDRRLRVALDSSRRAPAALSRDGRRLAVAFPGIVQIVDLTNGTETSVATGPADDPDPRVVSWSPDGKSLAVLRSPIDQETGTNGESTLEVAGPGRSARRFSTVDRPRGLAWSPDGTKLATVLVYAVGGAREDRVFVSGRTQILDVARGTATVIPPQAGLIVGWQSDGLVLSAALPRAGADTPPGGPTTTSDGSEPGGLIRFLTPDGKEVRRLSTPAGFLNQTRRPFDPDGRYGLLTPSQSGGEDPYAVVIDLADGRVAGTLRDRRSVPQVLGLGPGTVIVIDEFPPRMEVKAVDWSTGGSTLLCTLPFRFPESIVVGVSSDVAIPST